MAIDIMLMVYDSVEVGIVTKILVFDSVRKGDDNKVSVCAI